MKVVIYVPPVIVTIEFRIVSIYWARSPISFKHIAFWCLSLDPYSSTYRSDTGVQIVAVLESGMSTLIFLQFQLPYVYILETIGLQDSK